MPYLYGASLGGGYSFAADPDNADYLYRRIDLAELPGRRYAAKRNHVHRFERALRITHLELRQRALRSQIVRVVWLCSAHGGGVGDERSRVTDGIEGLRA